MVMRRVIITVQYRRILDGHVVGMVRCDLPLTVAYIIMYCIAIIFTNEWMSGIQLIFYYLVLENDHYTH